jgi:hypothetical protein
VAFSSCVAVWPLPDPFELPKLICAVVGLLPCLQWLKPQASRYSAPLLALAVSFIVPCLVSRSWQGFWWGSEAVADGFVAFALGALLLLVSQSAPVNRDLVLRAWLLGATAAGAYAICQRFVGDPIPWDIREAGNLDALTYRPFGFLGNPSFLAMILAMALPLCLLLKGRLGLVALAICGFALTLTMSRAGIAMGALVLILAAWKLENGKGWLLLGLSAMALGGLASSWNAPTSTAERFKRIETGSTQVRLELYRAGFRAFREKPIQGWGPGHTATALLSAESNLRESERLNPSFHNVLLDAAVQRGLLGLFATLWFAVVAAQELIRSRQVALGLSALAYLGCLLVGFATVGPWLSLCLLLGLAANPRNG